MSIAEFDTVEATPLYRHRVAREVGPERDGQRKPLFRTGADGVAIEDGERWPLSLTFAFVTGFCTFFWLIVGVALSAVL